MNTAIAATAPPQPPKMGMAMSAYLTSVLSVILLARLVMDPTRGLLFDLPTLSVTLRKAAGLVLLAKLPISKMVINNKPAQISPMLLMESSSHGSEAFWQR